MKVDISMLYTSTRPRSHGSRSTIEMFRTTAHPRGAWPGVPRPALNLRFYWSASLAERHAG